MVEELESGVVVVGTELEKFTDKELLDFAFGGLMNNLKGLKLVRKSKWKGERKVGYSYREVFVYDNVTETYYRYYLSRIKVMIGYKYELIKRPEVSSNSFVMEPSSTKLSGEFTLNGFLRDLTFDDYLKFFLYLFFG